MWHHSSQFILLYRYGYIELMFTAELVFQLVRIQNYYFGWTWSRIRFYM